MKFMGSKNRIAKFILPIMLKNRKPEQFWVEPFVGGGNIIDKVTGNRIGGDYDKNVINALITIRDNIEDLPKDNTEFTENQYKALKYNHKYKYRAYAGFAFSYGGKWMGGWRRDKDNKRDYISEAYKNAKNQSSKLLGVKFIHSHYDELIIPNNSIIYCDPPYKNTTTYKSTFYHEGFWEWCRQQKNKGHTVFISEYSAPSDFNCIWSKSIVSSLTKNTGSKVGIEKLFIL